MKTKMLTALLVTFVTGCASGVIPIGRDNYMMTDIGAWSWSSGAELKAGLYQQADKFCRDKGKELLPVHTSQNDASSGLFHGSAAHAELQFRCE